MYLADMFMEILCKLHKKRITFYINISALLPFCVDHVITFLFNLKLWLCPYCIQVNKALLPSKVGLFKLERYYSYIPSFLCIVDLVPNSVNKLKSATAD